MFIPQDDGSFANRWGHSLLYRDPVIAAINRFANDFIEYPELTSTHGNVALIQRGEPGKKTGAVLVNVGDTNEQVNFSVQMKDGLYECAVGQAQYTVTDGRLTGNDIGAESVLILRVP